MIQFSKKYKDRSQIHVLVLGKKELEKWENEVKKIPDSIIPEIVNSFSGLSQEEVFYLEQTHGTEFREIDELSKNKQIGDALFTFEKNKALVVKTADCLPLFFWSESQDFCGVIHSGWKGTNLGITERLIKHIHKNHHIFDLDFFIGPCIRKQNYEIGQDVAQFFEKSCPESLTKFGDKFLFANDIVVKKQLYMLSTGYIPDDSGICNFEIPEYYSHRRKDSGRNLNIIWMN